MTITYKAVSIDDFGGDPTGAAASDAALAAALAAINLNGCVLFSSGQYLFNSAVTMTLNPVQSSIAFKGNGQSATLLNWPATDGLIFNMTAYSQSIHLRDLALTTGAAGLYTGLAMTQSSPLDRFITSTFENISIRGITDTRNEYWKMAASITNVCGTSWESVTVHGGSNAGLGTGLSFQGTGPSTSANYSIYHNISKGIFNELAYGIVYGPYAQGITIGQTNIENTSYGVYSVASSQSAGQSQLNVFDSELNCNTCGIYLGSPISNITIEGNDFIMFANANATAISVQQGLLGTIYGNNVNALGANSTFGIVLNNSNNFVVNGNVISGFGVGTLLQTPSNNCLVTDNKYVNCTNKLIDQGTQNQVLGDSAKPTAAIGVMASPFTYTAGSSPETHYIYGGNVSSIVKNGVTVASASGVTLKLAPHESYTVTYSSVPAISHDVH